ncbi:MAG: hypothetical protein LBL01_03715 [Bifidobacteriaceae bacterium]|nr:hypothetical protein [Bifidobacteriaceae bacterium]
MAIKWADSASKHGVSREDAVHAMLNPLLYLPEFDDPGMQGASRPDLWAGPPRRLGGDLIEVMAERVPPRDLVVFHVMPARPKHLTLMETER